jgi:hypothetical protein
MEFLNSDYPLSETRIAECEAACGVLLPLSLRECYLAANGGVPNPYVFENTDLDTVVSEFLPLASESRGTAVQCYQRLVLDRKIVPEGMFPFAMDGGGDYFFTDTTSRDGAVYFFRGDSSGTDALIKLNLGISGFWGALKPE